MPDKLIVVPIGPGKGAEKTLLEALQAVIAQMRGHVRDLRESGEEDQADLLELYSTALQLIWEQTYQSSLFGVGIQGDLANLARKYHLALPHDKNSKRV